MTFDMIVTVLIVAGLMAMTYLLGRIHQQSRDAKLIPAASDVDPFAHVAADMPDEVEAQRIAHDIEVTGYLDDGTGAILLPNAALESSRPNVEADLRAEVDALRVQVAHKEKLRARYLRLLRIERKRLAYMLGDVMDAPRRPRKATLLQLHVAPRLTLVPPTKAREWRTALAA